jgi:sporulation protein YlmC with PRC-barrel domain
VDAPEVMASDTLAGDLVVNRDDAELGTIDDILIDVRRGTVAYAVLAPEGILGLGDRLFAIPWSALTLDAARRCFILDADPQRLEKAPRFDKDHGPVMADAAWAHQVHRHYGVRPYWDDSTAA